MATHCGLGLGEPVAGDNADVGHSGLVIGGDYWIGVKVRIRVEGVGGGHDRRVGLGRRERREGIGFGFYDLVSVGFTIEVAKSSLGFTVGCAVFCAWIRFVLDGFPWVLQWVDDGNDGRYPMRGFDFFAMDCVGLVWFAIDCVGLIFCQYDFLSLDFIILFYFFPI